MRNRKYISIWILGIILIGLAGTSTVFASELPRGMVIADNDGITVNKDDEYFIDIPDVKPGEVYKKEITLRSTNEKEPFELGLRVQSKESKGIIDWNDHISMTLKLDGQEIYKGKMLGDGKRDWSKEELSLGEFGFGTDKVLEVIFEINKELTTDDFKKDNEFLFSWQFIATKKGTAISPEPANSGSKTPWGRLPSTGEEWRQIIYQLLVGLLLLLIVLLLWKRQRERKNEEK